MKIAVISDHIPSNWAHSVNTVNHAQSFFEMGNEVYLIYYKKFFESRYWKINDIHKFYGISNNIKLKSFVDFTLGYFQDFGQFGNIISSINNFLQIYSYSLFAKINNLLNRFSPKLAKILIKILPSLRILAFLKEKKIDLIYCRRSSIIHFIALNNKINAIMECHNKGIAYYDRYQIKYSKYQEFLVLNTISDYLKEIFIKQGIQGQKVNAIDDAVDIKKFDKISISKDELKKKLGFPLDKKIILYSGTMQKNRGIDTILQAINSVDYVDLIFYFVGGNSQELMYWNDFCSENKINKKYIFLGYKPAKTIPEYLKAADILIAPYSKMGRTTKWMSPIKIFEYMASKTPMIVSKLPRIMEICTEEDSIFFEPDSPIDLANKIQDILKNYSNYIIKADLAYQKALTFTYNSRCKKLLEYYKK